ncbi:methyl-accepting chemotaxis protein [Paenibacillus sp. WLX1005]|uniref:methyl-accepting chemotaxis protein n=1 Tax=unclassified Paenibacillus TaxID=185978 RepID=UPI003984175F
MLNNVDTQNTSRDVRENLIIKALQDHLAIISFDLNRQVAYVNDNFAQAMGYRKEEMLGMYHKQFCFPEFVNSPDYEQMWNGLMSGRSFQDKFKRMDAHGNVIWLEATYMPVYNEDRSQIISINKIATDITARQRNISELMQEMKQMANDLSERAEVGTKRNQELLVSIESIADVAAENNQNLKTLQEQAKSIQGIVQTIRDIASQTHLLSLNAAIEAAHAGEFGRGFDVVAKEVRKLSGMVQSSIIEIKQNIDSITTEIQVISKGTDDVQRNVEHGQQQVQSALSEFSELASSARQLDVQASSITRII